MITIKEIAALAGTSRGTVDRALKGRPGVNPETKERIERICREHQYIPNRAGVMLGLSKKQFRVGAVLPSLDNHLFDGIIRGFERAEEEFSDFGVRVELFELGYSEAEQLAAIDRLAAGGMQALVISPVPGAALERRFRSLEEAGVGVVTLGTDLLPRKAHISGGWERCGRAAGELCTLLAAGSGANVSVGAVGGSPAFAGNEERLQSFLETVKGCSQVSVRRIVECEPDLEVTAEKIRKMLKNYPEISCLFVAPEAVPALPAAIPARIAVVCVGESDEAEDALKLGKIRLTVSEQGEKQGELAIRLVVDACVNGRPVAEFHEIPAVIRNKYGY